MSDNNSPISNDSNDAPTTKVWCGLCGYLITCCCADYTSCPNWIHVHK